MSEIIKIGFIDYYLDEWHANNYPEFIRKASGGKAAAVYAYGHIDSPKGGRHHRAVVQGSGAGALHDHRRGHRKE